MKYTVIDLQYRDSHKNIVEFLKMRDGKGANLAMQYHLTQGLEDVEK